MALIHTHTHISMENANVNTILKLYIKLKRVSLAGRATNLDKPVSISLMDSGDCDALV